LHSPAVAKLKHKWAAELENEGLRNVMRKVKDRELELAAAEAVEAADLYQAFELECQELAQKNESLTLEAAGLRADLSDARAAIQKLSTSGGGSSKSPWEVEMLEEAHAAIHDMSLENKNLAAENLRIAEQRGSLSCEKKGLQARVQALSTQFEEACQENSLFKAELETQKGQYRQIQEGLGGVEEMVLAREKLASSEVSNLREQHAAAAAEADALASKLRASEGRLGSISGEKEALEARLREAVQQLESCRTATEKSEMQMEEAMEEASSRIAALTLQNRHLGESLKQAQEERDAIGHDIATTSKVLVAIQANSRKAAEAAQRGRLKEDGEGLVEDCATALRHLEQVQQENAKMKEDGEGLVEECATALRNLEQMQQQNAKMKEYGKGLVEECATALRNLEQVQQENAKMKRNLVEMSSVLAHTGLHAEERACAASLCKLEAEQTAVLREAEVGQLQSELVEQASECERRVRAAEANAFDLQTEVSVCNAALETATGENIKLKEVLKDLRKKDEQCEEDRRAAKHAPAAVIVAVPVVVPSNPGSDWTPPPRGPVAKTTASLEVQVTPGIQSPPAEPAGASPGESPDVGLIADVFREALLEVRMRSRRAARRRGARGSRRPAADPEYQRRLRALGLPVSPLVSRKDRAG